MGRVMQIAAFSLAEVSYAVGGDIGYQIQESVKSARFRIKPKQENVSGVMLPQFEGYTKDEINDFGLTGLGKGGQQVQRCRETYTRAVETLVELASLQTAFMILDEVIKVVNRRGMVLVKVSLKKKTDCSQSTPLNMLLFRAQKTPSSVSTTGQFDGPHMLTSTPDINSELDELDREEFYRLKKVSGKKQRDQAAADAEMKQKREAGKGKPQEETDEEPKDVLGEREDEDVIF